MDALDLSITAVKLEVGGGNGPYQVTTESHESELHEKLEDDIKEIIHKVQLPITDPHMQRRTLDLIGIIVFHFPNNELLVDKLANAFSDIVDHLIVTTLQVITEHHHGEHRELKNILAILSWYCIGNHDVDLQFKRTLTLLEGLISYSGSLDIRDSATFVCMKDVMSMLIISTATKYEELYFYWLQKKFELVCLNDDVINKFIVAITQVSLEKLCLYPSIASCELQTSYLYDFYLCHSALYQNWCSNYERFHINLQFEHLKSHYSATSVTDTSTTISSNSLRKENTISVRWMSLFDTQTIFNVVLRPKREKPLLELVSWLDSTHEETEEFRKITGSYDMIRTLDSKLQLKNGHSKRQKIKNWFWNWFYPVKGTEGLNHSII